MAQAPFVPAVFQAAPQRRPTSRPLSPLDKTPVRLLVGPLPLPVVTTRSGRPAKRQPKPFEAGQTAWISRRPDGTLALFPFALAGTGYELVKDAEEGVHFAFLLDGA